MILLIHIDHILQITVAAIVLNVNLSAKIAKDKLIIVPNVTTGIIYLVQNVFIFAQMDILEPISLVYPAIYPIII